MITTARHNKNKYPAYTLMELLVVMSIFMIFGTMSLTSFTGLQNTVKMNEYMLNMEQNIRLVQRSAMLLERDADERWLYGLGVDFSDTADEEGQYKVFKWCSEFNDYGDIKTTSDFPGYDEIGDVTNNNGFIPPLQYTSSTCPVDEFGFSGNSELITLSGMDISYSPPQSVITFGTDVRYVLFESVSGRAFFYDSAGALLNYNLGNGIPSDTPVNFEITISPTRGASARRLIVDNMSGRISTEVLDD